MWDTVCGLRAGLTVVQGWRIVAVAAAAPVHAGTSVVFPVMLLCIPLAVVASGLAPQLLGPGSRNAGLLAAGVTLLLTATVAITSLRYPIGTSTTADVRFHLDCAQVYRIRGVSRVMTGCARLGWDRRCSCV